MLPDCAYCGNVGANSGGIVFHGVSSKKVAGCEDMGWSRYSLRIADVVGFVRAMSLGVGLGWHG